MAIEQGWHDCNFEVMAGSSSPRDLTKMAYGHEIHTFMMNKLPARETQTVFLFYAHTNKFEYNRTIVLGHKPLLARLVSTPQSRVPTSTWLVPYAAQHKPPGLVQRWVFLAADPWATS